MRFPLVTANLSYENSTEVLGSERLTGALLERLTHSSSDGRVFLRVRTVV